MVFLIPVAVFLLALVFIALMTTGEPLNPTRPLMSYDQAREHARKLARMIQCRTVSQEDSYDEGEFDKLRDVMAENFPLVHKNCRRMTFGEDCWAYVLAGLNDERNILLMAHHDVAQADGEWKRPPFSGQIQDAKLWGRGAVDTKTSLYGIFAALEELLGEGFFPECNVWIASSGNGKVAGSGIALAAEYFREQGITFELVLDAGGAVVDPPLPGMLCPKCAMVGIHEKGRHQLILKASEEQPSAGSKGTPTERMAAFITEFRNSELFIRRMNPQLEEMVRAMTPYMNFSRKLMFANLWCFRPFMVKLIPKVSPRSAEFLGTCCVFNDIQTLEEGRECVAKILLRTVNHEDLKKDLEQLESLARKYGIAVSDGTEREYHAPADTALPQFELVSDSIRSVFPDVPVIPFIHPEATDGRLLTELCPCVLRFAPLRLTAQQLASARGTDENIDITAIGACISFYLFLLKKYSSACEEESAVEETASEETSEEEIPVEETAVEETAVEETSEEEIPAEEPPGEEVTGNEIDWEEIAGDGISWEEINGEEIPGEEMDWETLIGDVLTEENSEEEREHEQSEE